MYFRHGKFFWLLLAAALLFLLAGGARAAEFSSVIVTNSHGQERLGKIYVQGDNIRREFATPLGNMVIVVRGDKKVMWMLQPGQQSYLEMPFDKEALSKTLSLPKDEASKKLVGTETLKGYATDKYETSVKTGSGDLQGTMWVSKQLGVPIRIETADKSFVQEYKDIKEGGVDAALFELPQGYQKMAGPPGAAKMK